MPLIGQEAVDWVMAHTSLKSRQIVCDLGARLIARKLIVCISKGNFPSSTFC